LRACRELNLTVPEDVEIIGVDDIPFASLVTPALSTLCVAKRQLGATAMNTLLHLMEPNNASESGDQIIKPQLLLRESTAAP
jgi:LacI family transcriptional regulator